MLRRFSIDEVPNVLNVLRGEMSLVGPRPLPIRDYELLEPWHRRRYNVLPGMTGLWQIAGRSDLTFDDLVRLDFYYLENWSIWLDISILVKTPFAVLARRRVLAGEDPVALVAAGFELRELLSMDLANSGRGDRLLGADLFDREARLVLVEMLARQSGLAVIGPDEGLPARGVVERGRIARRRSRSPAGRRRVRVRET